jgi:hypothetical protein
MESPSSHIYGSKNKFQFYMLFQGPVRFYDDRTKLNSITASVHYSKL